MCSISLPCWTNPIPYNQIELDLSSRQPAIVAKMDVNRILSDYMFAPGVGEKLLLRSCCGVTATMPQLDRPDLVVRLMTYSYKLWLDSYSKQNMQ